MSAVKYARLLFALSLTAFLAVFFSTMRGHIASHFLPQTAQETRCTSNQPSPDRGEEETNTRPLDVRLKEGEQGFLETSWQINGHRSEIDRSNTVNEDPKGFGGKRKTLDLLHMSKLKMQSLSRVTVMNGTSFTTADDYRGENSVAKRVSIDRLAEILQHKIHIAAGKIKEIKFKRTCASNATLANSCDGSRQCLRKKLPASFKERVSQLVTPGKLQISNDIHKALSDMAQQVSGHYDVVLLTAASSNHYLEAQAMIKNVHDNVMPMLKNFTFIFYDIGLSASERRAMRKMCKCHVLDFPFEKFPRFMKELRCFSWKPLIIKAHVQQANVAIWADASIRFHSNPDHLSTLIEQTRRRGLQLYWSKAISPFRTFTEMYHFFGDEPCAYLHMNQVVAGIGFYTSALFVDRVILEPWAACAVRRECMCDLKISLYQTNDCSQSNQMAEDWKTGSGSISYGLCHRFDQSAISLILHKLYQGYFSWPIVNMGPYLDIRRNDRLDYFSKSKPNI